MDEEVNILGGGISGLACAIILRKNGYNVNVYEKRDYTGKRFNNDWQGLENWSEKIDVLQQIESYGIDLSFDYEPLYELDLHYSNKIRTIRVENACYLVKRGSYEDCLDINLLEQAKKLGVNVQYNSNLDEKIPIHINASGPKTASALVKGIKFNTDHEDGYHMAFGDKIAKGFYSYLLIKDGHGTIATVFNRKKAHLSENYLLNTARYFSKYVSEKELSSGKKFGGYGNFEIKKSFYDENGAILIGEAAGFQDYLWGFGMRYALQSANFAARSIMHGESYDDLIKEHLLAKMKHSKRNRHLFEIMGPLAYPLAYYLLGGSKDPLKLLNMVYR
ncbi:NAD(P)/FAD-dependent oxidoreductase [Methanolobus sp. ZRKC3]|uniref:NAD(P)/FAD-dependent oxidoreductase n=1 Tax=Methanolobus sp. ZRKC3 TaxID=3125786 RepID=UPI003248CA67